MVPPDRMDKKKSGCPQFFSLDLGFFCFIWGSGVFIENLGFFVSGQILEMYVVLLYFPFTNTVVSHG